MRILSKINVSFPGTVLFNVTLLVLVSIGTTAWVRSAPDARVLTVGAYAMDITPPEEMLPLPFNGGITAKYSDNVVDPLHSRTIVLDDGTERIAIVVVDSCIMDRELLDQAKGLAQEATGIPSSKILISATHTHSAPAVTGAHGTDPDPRYREFLIQKIAKGIQEADQMRVPAQIGWGVSHNDDYVFCRRWRMKPGTARSVPHTGRSSDQVQMNPGNNNPNRIGPTGPVDTAVTVLSVQTREGRPLALLGNYSTHYAGAPALSADYFAVFAKRIGELIGADAGPGSPFVGMMSNGTSGDANCSNFAQSERKRYDRFMVGDEIARTAFAAYQGIEYYDWVPIVMEEDTVKFDVRMPTAEEVREAEEYLAENMKGLPKNIQESYARETVLLSEMPPYRQLRLQAIRLGDFGITAAPAELYGITGLKLKAGSPLEVTMNISLANGFVGYVPPPDQHELGGYTTWRARSSCLEVGAEPKIREILLRLLNRTSSERREQVALSSR